MSVLPSVISSSEPAIMQTAGRTTSMHGDSDQVVVANSLHGILQTRLDTLYQVIQNLSPTASDADFAHFASFFTPSCRVFLKSMNLARAPGVTRQGAIEDMKETASKVRITERVVLNSALGPDGRTLFCETRQILDVMGTVIDLFMETEVVKFELSDSGEPLIAELKLYNCWSPIVRIVQDKTGRGPYSEGEKRVEWENFVKRMMEHKMQHSEQLKSSICCN